MGLNDLFQKKLKGFGIPIKYTKIADLPFWDAGYSAEFCLGRINLLVIGEAFYATCSRLMQLKLTAFHLDRMKWISQSSIGYDFYPDHLDTLAIVELYSEPQDSRKRLAGAAVGCATSNGTTVLLGAKDIDCLEGAFPYDLESIENNFEVWKGD